ncbi:hypothetical protein [Roseobacter sp. HKCCA0434]|uniref:hypothetical protein n=1 Tax=Roseobacter sp. HKCCA0434 TaxID=3079297 RepID=UPI002905BC90|nr:hypothetical protein [Roseobacter sp. HKCCA0434]
MVNAELRQEPEGWTFYGIVYNVGDVPVTLYGMDGPDGEDGYIYAQAEAEVVELFEVEIAPGNALDLVPATLFLRFEELDAVPPDGVEIRLYFDDFEMPVETFVPG